MEREHFFLQDGQIYTPLKAALETAQQEFTKGHEEHERCDLVEPLVCKTPDGRLFCLGCFYLEAWENGYLASDHD
jgi:hypothetical protein